MLRDYAYPTNRDFWAVTYEGHVVRLTHDHLAEFWLRRPWYSNAEGEPGSYEPCELLGWTDSYSEALAVSDRLLKLEA